jgi:hypothetical protein
VSSRGRRRRGEQQPRAGEGILDLRLGRHAATVAAGEVGLRAPQRTGGGEVGPRLGAPPCLLDSCRRRVEDRSRRSGSPVGRAEAEKDTRTLPDPGICVVAVGFGRGKLGGCQSGWVCREGGGSGGCGAMEVHGCGTMGWLWPRRGFVWIRGGGCLRWMMEGGK